MAILFCATFLLLAGACCSSSASKIMVLIRTEKVFQVYCLFILTSLLITLMVFMVFIPENNLTLWYGVYSAVLQFLFIPSYALLFDRKYVRRAYIKVLLLLPFFLQILFVVINWNVEPSLFAYMWFPFYLIRYYPFPILAVVGVLEMLVFLSSEN